MFRKVLVANRGEIAVRIMQTCAELGIATVAVYSEADASALHVRRAGESYCLGPAAANQSYLNVGRIVEVAVQSGAQAIHPGYGFLAENADFAEACAAAGIVFVGPPPRAMRLLGSKQAAKRLARQAGVPVVPGYDGERQDDETLALEARRLGFPLLIKASAGGGGRGMRPVHSPTDFLTALAAARREATAAFGDDRVLLERFLDAPRHVEVQVLADRHGNVVHLGERECSLQRRHQKVVEESPCQALTPEQRERLGDAAVALARAAGYVNAGTVEFLLDRSGASSLLEVNTRLQVEHPVTELVTGVDLVREQLRIAAGLPLAFRQEDVVARGHAIECRLCAEDPADGFLPSTGRLLLVDLPAGPGVRVDAGVQTGDTVEAHYDSLFAKLIVHASNRAACVERMAETLRRCAVLGVTTNLDLLRAIMAWPAFRASRLSTTALEQHLPELTTAPPLPEEVPLLAAAWQLERGAALQPLDVSTGPAADPNPWHSGAWRLAGQEHLLRYRYRDHEVVVRAHRGAGGVWLVEVDAPPMADEPGAPARCTSTRRRPRAPATGDQEPAQGAGAPDEEAPAIVPTQLPIIGRPRRSDGVVHDLTVQRSGPTQMLFREGARAWTVQVAETADTLWLALDGRAYALLKPSSLTLDDAGQASTLPTRQVTDALRARMPGLVVKVGVQEGERVELGQTLLVLDSMKTEHLITAPRDGIVKRLLFAPGDQVPAGAVLVELEG